ncbi:bifunctional adenosylcobinamide kinase/adenosylcobinamide-phosphate guanylyltransferase [Blastomonas sp.]|uniref:bifunctional adenosylcobinamide kinase/adenosylcobinamide-phosphate guanylyltransferase n=1 Tax=Blastomonas sp. TaxID=1909299 RepID=UPI00261C8A2B|nr:bifunctional adenosylcobinamide kinase/adenosylcobinamide-phosphate guanylyltransferase [Blastomonas sp.]MDM7956094.1 bifunctional adenosylcobinamide kinase/adenosylcobinamide-phosphate guanylyltransferase [Blastomonas sp.]
MARLYVLQGKWIDVVLTFITGGARSGKSMRAQMLAESQEGDLVYLATAQAFDDEMTDRIARHQADRDARWRTVECPIDLPETIAREAGEGRVLLVDCLTLWTSNLLLGEHDFAAASQQLLGALASANSPVILVSNEVGMGIVPDNALARQFRDMAGRLNQQVAAIADRAELVVSGLSLTLKP